MSERDLYVYAVVPSSLPHRGLGTGIGGAELRLVTAGRLAAVVHDHEGGPLAGTDAQVKDWILEHSDVVERIWERAGTALPMTFNVIAAAQEAPASERLGAWLAGASVELSRRLDALREKVELHIEITLDQSIAARDDARVAGTREQLESRPPGVQRLLRKKLETVEREVAEQLADSLRQEYRRRLSRLSEELVDNRPAAPDPGFARVLAVASLVRRVDVQRIGGVLGEIGEEQAGARIRFLGPWPPYSFVELPELAQRDASGRSDPARVAGAALSDG